MMNITITKEETILRISFFIIGFSPIVSLSLSAFTVLPLHYSGPLIILPIIGLILFLCGRYRSIAELFLKGVLTGIIAVIIYDAFRLPFVFSGHFKDFIPKIGNYLFNTTDIHWTIGYLWRYIGNGGGMGMAFCMIVPFFPLRWKLKLKLIGIFYGILIFACLIGTVYLSPFGTKYLFKPSLFTGFIAFVGHVIYGYVLGSLYPPIFRTCTSNNNYNSSL